MATPNKAIKMKRLGGGAKKVPKDDDEDDGDEEPLLEQQQPQPPKKPAAPAPPVFEKYARNSGGSGGFSGESRIPSWMRINLRRALPVLELSPVWVRRTLAGIAGAFFVASIVLLIDADISTRYTCNYAEPLWWPYVLGGPIPTLAGALILITTINHEMMYEGSDEEQRAQWIVFFTALSIMVLGICSTAFNLARSYVPSGCPLPWIELLLSAISSLLCAVLFKCRLFIEE